MVAIPETALLAVIKAHRPQFRSNSSKIAFATHAFLEASGCTLIACGQGVAEGQQANAPEATIEGWDADDACFQFQYRTPHNKSLLLKCLPVEDSVLLHWAVAGTEIKSLEVPTAEYTTDDNSSKCGLKEVQAFINFISPGLEVELQDRVADSSAARTTQTTSTSTGDEERSLRDERLPDRGERFPGMGPGSGDLYPEGLSNPLMVGGSRQGHGGGMHVGPNDPIFRGIGGGRPGSSLLPPGARYDPIGPDGIPGFHPDDFVSGQSRQDAWNDLGPPPGMGGGPFGSRGGGRGLGGPGFGGGMFG